MIYHDLEEVLIPPQGMNVPAGAKLWHCKRCDTMVAYDARMSKHDVNQIFSLNKSAPCIHKSEGGGL